MYGQPLDRLPAGGGWHGTYTIDGLTDIYWGLADSVNTFTSDVNVSTLNMGAALFSNSINNNNSLFIKVDAVVKYNKMEFHFCGSLQRSLLTHPSIPPLQTEEFQQETPCK